LSLLNGPFGEGDPAVGHEASPQLPAATLEFMKVNRNQAHVRRLRLNQKQAENASMERKQAAKRKRNANIAAVTTLGAAGLGLSLAGSAASATPTADIPQSQNTPPNQRFVLGDEEMADVSLATFHLFDREYVGDLQQGNLQQLAVVVVRRGCGGCRACRACGGCAWRGCAGCGGCGGCCARWGRCRWC
jgi:hypothetical protein